MDLLAAEISELSGKSPVDPNLRSIPYRAPQSTHHGPWSLSPSCLPRGETPIPSNISTEASPTLTCLPRGPLTTILASDHGLSFGPANGLLQPGCSNLGLLSGSDDLNYDVHAVYNDMGSTVYPPFPTYPWNGQAQQELSSSGMLEQEEGILTRRHQSLEDAKQCSTSAAQDSWISKSRNSSCIIAEVDRQLQERNKDMERTDESKDEEIVKSTIKDNFQSTDTTQVKRTIADGMTNDNECHTEKINCQSSPLSKDVLHVDPSPEKDEGTIHSSSTTFEKKVNGEGDQGKPLDVQATMEDVTQVEDDQNLQQFGVGKIDQRVQNETLEQDLEKVNGTQPECHKNREEDKFESDIRGSKEAESQRTGSRGRHWKANEPAAPAPSFPPGSAECLGPNCRNAPAAGSSFCSHRCILQQAACAIQQFERGQRTYKSGMPPTLVSIKQETISFIVCNDKEDSPIGDTGMDKEVVNGEHIIVNGTAGDLQLLGDTSQETDATGVRRFSDTTHGQQAQPKNKLNKNGIPTSSFYKTALQKSKKLCLQSRLELGTGAVLHLRKPSMERKPRLHLVEEKGSKNNFGNAERIKENAPASKSSHAGDLSSRQIVRRGLKDILSQRLRENEDLSTTLKDVMKIAAGIEKELHSLFGSTSAKYKMKYRSLLFNLKDFKNPGLSHRVLTRDISPCELVNATPEQLASPELAGWRKRENEHMIELIEKEQQLKEHRPTAKITHKGLVEIGEPASIVDLQDSLSASEMPLTEKLHKGKERSGKNKMEVTGGQEGSFEHDNDCDGTTSKVSDEKPSEHSDCSCRTSPQERGREKAFPGSPRPVPQSSKAEGTGVGFEALPGSVPCQTDGMGDNQLEGTDRSEEKTNDDSCPEATQGSLSKDAIALQAKEQHPSEILGAKPGCGYIWKGFLCLPNVAKVVVKAYPVTGLFDNLTEDLPDSILIGGRISPHIVWDYLEKVKTVATKGISIIHFHPASEDEQEGYSALFTYLSKRQRCGVISASSQAVKDLYIVPYGTSNEVPANLLPQIQANTTYAESILGVLVQVRVRREPADEQSSTPSYSEQKMTSRANRKCKQNETSACVMSGSEPAAGELKKAAKGDKSKESALHLAPKSSTATESHCAIPAAEKPENNETPTARKADLSSSESAKSPDKSGIRNERFEHTSTEYSCPSELGDCVSTFPERGTVDAQKGSFRGGKMCSGLNFERDEGIATKFQPNDGKRIIKETNIAIDPVPRRQSHSSHSATKDKATASGDCFDFEKWDVVRSNSVSDPRINRLTLTKEGYLPRNTLQSDDVCTQSVKGDSQRLSLDLLQEIQRLLSKNIDRKLRESATLAEQIVEQDVKSSCNKRIWSSDSEMDKESDNNFNLVDYQTFDYQHGLQSKLPSKYNTEHESLVKTPFSRPASTATHKLDTGQMEGYREMSHGSELDWQQQQNMSRPSLKRLHTSSSLDEMVHSNYLSKQSRGLLPTPPTDLSIQHHGPVIPPPPPPPPPLPLPPPPPPPFQPMRSEPHGYPFPPFNPPPFTNPGYPAFWPPRMRFFPFRPPPPWGFQRPPRYARHCNPRFSSQRFRPFNADLEHVPLPPTVCYSEDLDCENSPVTSEVSHDFSAKSIAPQTAEQLKAHYDKSAISHMHPQGNQHLSRQSIPHVLGQVQSDIDNIPLRLQSDRNQGNCPSAQAPDCFDSLESNSPPMSPLSV